LGKDFTVSVKNPLRPAQIASARPQIDTVNDKNMIYLLQGKNFAFCRGIHPVTFLTHSPHRRRGLVQGALLSGVLKLRLGKNTTICWDFGWWNSGQLRVAQK
jgi:hypothetical protein